MNAILSLEPRKSIEYDRTSRDYAYKFDGEIIGYERSYHSAETALNEYVHTLLTDGALPGLQAA